ncbi:MAG: CBS domain-containing protein [Gemmiger sp.]|nr:CBS domain-containing protein [Gemmiger sp.]
MNLLFFLTPKQDVLYIYEDFTLRQTLEKWSNQRYATIPVLRRNGEYLGSMTEGDLLWGIKNTHGLDLDASEDVPIASFARRRDYKAVPVTTDMPTLLGAAIEQNFVPVVDDRNVFIGIVRRTVVLRHLYNATLNTPEALSAAKARPLPARQPEANS